jgi:uncharacterized protein (DUF2141 family)
MKLLRLLCCGSVLLFLALSCAKQSSPSGGPKDTIPPILVQSIPHHKELQFNGKEVELTFSEFIILNNPKDQIIITPSIGKDYKVTAKKKTVFLELEKSLDDSTTYTINFRESIQDITEKNPIKNLQLAFSTGNYIDSLSIDGSVVDLLNNKEIKEGTVALYQQDTFNIFKHKPSYITKTNEKGLFKLENLKPGKYFIYANDDKNKNLIVDSKSESYGFLSNDTLLLKNISNLTIPIQKLDARNLKLTSARPYNNYFNIKTSKNLKDFNVTTDSLKIYSSFGEDASNIKIYNTFKGVDSLKVSLTVKDSIGNKLDTALFVKFSSRETDKEKFTMSLVDNTIEANKGQAKVKLKFNKPVIKTSYDSLFFSIDSTTTINLNEKDLMWNDHFTEVAIQKKIEKAYLIKEKADPKSAQSLTRKAGVTNTSQNKIMLLIGSNTFISVDNDSSKKMSEIPKILREEETAILILKIKTSEKNYIVELLDKTFKVIQSYKNIPDLKIENLIPAGYIIRLIIDKNGDGIWSQGNYFKKEQPEPATFYKTEKGEILVNLKANWEVGPLLITY